MMYLTSERLKGEFTHPWNTSQVAMAMDGPWEAQVCRWMKGNTDPLEKGQNSQEPGKAKPEGRQQEGGPGTAERDGGGPEGNLTDRLSPLTMA